MASMVEAGEAKVEIIEASSNPIILRRKIKEDIGYKYWYPKLRENSAETEVIELNSNQLDFLLGKETEEKKDTNLQELSDAIDRVIKDRFEGADVIVKLNVAGPYEDFFSSEQVSPELRDNIRIQVLSQVELERQLGRAADCSRKGTFRRRMTLPQEAREQPNHVPRSALKEESSSDAHNVQSVNEPLENAVLRAFNCKLIESLHVSSGKLAVNQLMNSPNIQFHLKQIYDVNGSWDASLPIYVVVRKWNKDFARYPGMRLRGFVTDNTLRALTQKDTLVYYPNLANHQSRIQERINSFYVTYIAEKFKDLKKYIVDFFVGPDYILVTNLLPYDRTVGACLFTWPCLDSLREEDTLNFRIVCDPCLNCLTSLPSFWEKEMLLAVVDLQKHSQLPAGRTCSLV